VRASEATGLERRALPRARAGARGAVCFQISSEGGEPVDLAPLALGARSCSKGHAPTDEWLLQLASSLRRVLFCVVLKITVSLGHAKGDACDEDDDNNNNNNGGDTDTACAQCANSRVTLGGRKSRSCTPEFRQQHQQPAATTTHDECGAWRSRRQRQHT
jgi:hypothetical protein